MATPAKRGQPRVAVEWQWRRDKTRQVRTPAAVALPPAAVAVAVVVRSRLLAAQTTALVGVYRLANLGLTRRTKKNSLHLKKMKFREDPPPLLVGGGTQQDGPQPA
jgi:hypothetical protein